MNAAELLQPAEITPPPFRLEIVSHCWRYARLLTYQLSSLWLYPPRTVQVQMTIYCASREHDPATWDVLDYFTSLPRANNVTAEWRELPTSSLFRRAIGRNHAARSTTADWVWFADCDMVLREGTCDALPVAVAGVDGPLVYPEFIQIQREHALGDAAMARVNEGMQLLDIDPDEFVPHRYNRAIGGVQIVAGDIARERGYCPESRWQRPAAEWQRCRDDHYFRKSLGTRGRPITLPQVFRLRHSRRGADEQDVCN